MHVLSLTSVVRTEIRSMPAITRGHEYVVPTEEMAYGRSAPSGEMGNSLRRWVNWERERNPSFR